MNSRTLIDAIVRQTTILIARLSTADGARSPLGHVANEVFVGLVNELESQGVSKKVIADMFGLALRSYRQKVQRLGESATAPGTTLWSAVQTYLAEVGSATRIELVGKFQFDEEASVRGILNDLAESGLIVKSGRGSETRFRLATAEELRDLGSVETARPQDTNAALVWVLVYREGPLERPLLSQLLPLPTAALDSAVETLLADGRLQSTTTTAGEVLTAKDVLIPVGEAAGWEASVVDHHRAVLAAIAAKLSAGALTSTASDEVGGTTLTFDLWPGHPKEAAVRALLRTTRESVLPLWEEVTDYNRKRTATDAYQVHYYMGQYVVKGDDTA